MATTSSSFPVSDFDLFFGINYSGAQTPTSRLKSLHVGVGAKGIDT